MSVGDKERKLKDKASKLYADGKLKDALKLYEGVVAQDPSELQCRIKIGDIYRKLGERAAAVNAYEPVAHAYAEDGLLLKAIAVCKLILSVDPRHTKTQEMLGTLYSKQKVPMRMPGPPPKAVAPPVRLPTPPPTAVPAPSPAPPPQWPPTPATMSAWPVAAKPAQPPKAPEMEPSIEDSMLDITVEDVEEEAPSPTIDNAAAEMLARDTSQEIESLLSEMDDEPLELEEKPGERPISLDRPKTASIEETWDGVISIHDLDAEAQSVKRAVEEVAQTLEIDDAPVELREAPPIELTQRITESSADLVSELERPQIPLFSDLPKSAFIELLVQMAMREMSPGEYVITEGEVGNSFFVVATGKVRVTRKADDGTEVTLAFLTDGAFFGEMALMQDGARTASVIVEEDSQIFEISKDVLDHVVQAYPSVANVLKNFYRQRLLSTVMATHPLFRPFDQEQRRGLMEMFKSKPFKKGDVILQQGKKGAGLFLLLNGHVNVVRKTEDGKSIPLAKLGTGDMFGEMSLLTNKPTTASVVAGTDCFVLRLSKKNFDEVIMTHPQILELVAQVSEERKSFNESMLIDQPALAAQGAILV